VYAIVRAGGRQEKVAVGDVVEMDRVSAAPGSSLDLTAVMLVDGDSLKTTAADLVGVTVTAEIVEHLRGPKIKIVNYKSKTGYRRRMGYRHDLTKVRVTGISTGK
jgi:large subunit ribosomal protein L21